MDYRRTFIQYFQHNEVPRANRCYTEAFVMLALNRSTEIQYSLFRHFFNFKTTAVKRQSTLQGIIVPLSFNTSSITKSHQANRGYTDAFIVLALNRSTEIQYPLFRHFFNVSTAAMKRQSTFDWILVILSFITSNIMKSHRAYRCYSDVFNVLDLNRSTEIQYPLIRHFFNVQYLSCEEIVYYSMDDRRTFIQYIQHNEVTSGQQVLYRCFHCASLDSKY